MHLPTDPPSWRQVLLAAYAHPSRRVLFGPEVLEENPGAGFLYLVEPLVRLYQDRFRAGVDAMVAAGAHLPFGPHRAWRLFAPTIMLRLQIIISKTMLLELHVARVRDQLPGATSAARFAAFVEQLRDPARQQALFREYPVLARKVIDCLDDWCNTSLELLTRLGADWSALLALCSSPPGELSRVQIDAGDRHRGGRSVTILTFDSGWRVVYKPRCLTVDKRFGDLVTWVNDRGFTPALRTMRVLERCTYGWMEFAIHHDCSSAEEVTRFYERVGGLLALMHLLEASDFHHENIVASGEHPVLIDFECLFSPQLPDEKAHDGDTVDAAETLARSVLRTGLLPRRLYLRPDNDGFDIGGLVSTQGERTPVEVPVFAAGGTDEMHVSHERVRLEPAYNRPRLAGHDVRLVDHADAIIAGFTRMYTLLLRQRESLRQPDGPIARFANDEIRVLLRMTGAYTHMITQSLHPDHLRGDAAQDRHWDALWDRTLTPAVHQPLVLAERAAGMRGDVPLFTTRVASRGIWWSGDEGCHEYFQRSGLERVQQRLELLAVDDLERQVWVIKASLATAREKVPVTRRVDPPARCPADRYRLLEHACRVGERLIGTAIRHGGQATWLGLSMTGDDHFSVLPLGRDLYSGLPGQALFLAHLGQQTSDSRFVDLAQEAVAALLRQTQEPRNPDDAIGAFAGWGGVIYVLAHLASLWRAPALAEVAEQLAANLEPAIEADRRFDVVYGAAGCLGGLLALHRSTGSPLALRLAGRCAQRLIDTAIPREGGLAWELPRSGALVGFAHGAGGIAWSLAELHREAPDERLVETILDALRYERQVLRAQARQPPLATADENGAEPRWFAWCKGASGIALGRLRLREQLRDDLAGDEISAALAATSTAGFGVNHSLCHGDMGNLELYIEAGGRDTHHDLLDQARWIAARTLDGIDAHGWRCGVPTGVETPGLMTGITGIGYGCLRLAAPEAVPSVLLLESPPRWR
jgi:type 2 lantibiotic biosynthesis protein LanM